MGPLGGARSAYGALGLGLVLLVVYVPLMNGSAGSAIYLGIASYTLALSVAGTIRMPRAQRRTWAALAAGQAMFLVGDFLWTLFEDVLDIDPFPSVADVFYLLGYPALALGLLGLVRARRRGRDRAAFLDAAILTTGFTVVGAVFFVAPAAETGGSTLLSQVVAAAYPAGDLLVLAVVVRMFTTGIIRNPALWALFGSIALLLVADLDYVVTVLEGAAYPGWIDVAFLGSYLALTFAILHPSTSELSEPAPERPERITRLRLAVLGAALVLAPVTEEVAHVTGAGASLWIALAGGALAAVLVVLRLGDLVQSLERQAVQLAALARRDALTGIPNRRTWDHELSRACAAARESGSPLAVAVLDMDHFKRFNDTYGHLKGDLVLKETAAAWSSILDGRGVLARFGGEEFTALIPHASTADAVAVLDQMRRAVTHGQTCSIGVAVWNGLETPAELVARADRALYRAKAAGRDRVAADDGFLASVVTLRPEQHPMVAALRSVFQPIVDLRNGEVVGCEALSRFAGRETREVFERAARDGTSTVLEVAAVRSALAQWDGAGMLTLNTSPSTMLTEQLHDALPQDLDGIVLEMTEADLVGYSTEVMMAIDRLRQRGALIAIDDFGIGFSNIQRVVAIRPDIVKLDMSLVRGIDTDPVLQGVVAAALLFAEQTSSLVVAEGIETPEELACLTGLGVPLGQGLLLGAPEGAATRT